MTKYNFLERSVIKSIEVKPLKFRVKIIDLNTKIKNIFSSLNHILYDMPITRINPVLAGPNYLELNYSIDDDNSYQDLLRIFRFTRDSGSIDLQLITNYAVMDFINCGQSKLTFSPPAEDCSVIGGGHIITLNLLYSQVYISFSTSI